MTGPTTDTRARVIAAATVAFADRGVAGTSLDDLARTLGVTKQTVLYHFRSKDGLVAEVLTSGAQELEAVLLSASAQSEPGWDRIETVVRAAFGLAVARPELLGLLRELSRLGPDHSQPVLALLQPLVDAAVAELEAGMVDGRFRRSDPRLVLVSAYAAVTGVVTDGEVLRAVGVTLDLRVAARLRRTVLDFLRAALVPSAPAP
ncbi:MAG: TetR/AcrR family transcriptional regulator [Actinomycetota bacterium]